MTIEEKLHHFYKVSVESAEVEAEAEIRQYKKSLESMFEEHKAAKLKAAKMEIVAEVVDIKREINKELSAQQLLIKRELTRKYKEIQDDLFEKVEIMLREFTKTPEYMDHLCKKMEEAYRFAGGDDITFYLSPGDEALQTELVSRMGHPVEISDEDFIGGLRSVIPSKNILIDDTFSSLLETEKTEYKFDGGFPHE